jgi:hypothetical protein
MPTPIRSLLSAAVFALSVACGSATSTSSDNAPSLLDRDGNGRAVMIAEGASNDVWPNDPITIDAARIVGDSLVANVSHGGGCAEHRYGLLISTLWMESFPVQVPARISHNANGDNCKALLRRELHISLAPLAEAYRSAYKQDHGTISIRLTGSSASLLYRF